MRLATPLGIPLAIVLLVPVTGGDAPGALPLHGGSTTAACNPMTMPRALRGVDALVDSAGLVAQLAGVVGDPRLELTVSIRLGADPAGFLVGVEAPTAVQAELLDLVLASLRVVGSRVEAVRLVFLPGPTPVLRLERSVLCAPESSDVGVVRTPVVVGRVTSTSAAPRSMPSPRPVRTRIRISAAGLVQAVEIVEGSGVPEIDRSIMDTVRRQRYQPALLDGRPVEVWLTNGRVELAP